ncbi:MAG: Mpo1-like protein [Aquisalimonadaceae bacterium]
MKTTDQWLEAYGESHQNRTNKVIHWVCVPLIMLSVLGLLWSIPHGYLSAPFPGVPGDFINWATITVVVASLFYLRLSLPLFVGMVAISAAMLVICYLVDHSPLPLVGSSILVFVLAWIGQFVGHRIEGKKPSFFQDLLYLLIGPAWLLGFVYRYFGIRY